MLKPGRTESYLSTGGPACKREGQQLHLFVPIALVLLHVVLETLHKRAIKPLGLPIRLGRIGFREAMPQPYEVTYRDEDFCGELRTVICSYVARNPVDVMQLSRIALATNRYS